MIHGDDEIEVIALRILPGDRSLKAFADVQIGSWTVHDFRIVQQRGQRAFVSPPQVSWKDPGTGEIRFKGILTIPPEHKQMIDTMILHAYQVEMEKSTSGER